MATGDVTLLNRDADLEIRQMKTASNRIPTLDGWRAIAILAVTAFHTSLTIWSDRPDIILFTQYGALGVDVFFGLSGLLITRLLLEEHQRTGDISLKAFYIRRAFRVILPCYLFLAVLQSFSLIHSPLELGSGLLFFRNYLDEGFPGPYTVHLWSLAVEEHFYLLWPPLLVLVTVKRGKDAATWLAIAFGLWRIVYLQLQPSIASAANPDFRTDFRIDTLLWGSVVAFLLHKAEADFKRWLKPGVWAGLAVSYLACLLFYSPLTRLWMSMLLPVLIAGTAVHRDWPLSRFLDLACMRWIGRLSYSLYLWQMIFLAERHPTRWWQQFPANTLLVGVVAVISYYAFEGPLQKLGRRLGDQMSARTNGDSRPPVVAALQPAD